ncbi:hypothetical protein CY34DRAFT_92850 [Suillus luteus UH-Slu-Lm8-n1]|uniref:Uncharacterized protein n=1 Tax=Suillus luteus UH-Slu-Lm8-n1 TaxID=930992 RepID=A0A0D0A703_9AGAM|nr:hypothetical protein CY34DRAFT_92850 [Suillus luteus UH-Slu-Lm8-n1]
MFSSLSSTLAAAANASGAKDTTKKSMSPSLRTDIYNTIDQAKPWLIGGTAGRQAGDGVAYQPILSLIHTHFPDLKVGLDAARNVEHESAVIVAGITNMILEMSKWDGMAGAMAMRTWVDALGDAHGKISNAPSTGAKGGSRKDQVGRGITRGINQLTDVTLMTREFAARIQIISLLKSVNTKIHGAGSDEARQGEALWSSKFI